MANKRKNSDDIDSKISQERALKSRHSGVQYKLELISNESGEMRCDISEYNEKCEGNAIAKPVDDPVLFFGLVQEFLHEFESSMSNFSEDIDRELAIQRLLEAAVQKFASQLGFDIGDIIPDDLCHRIELIQASKDLKNIHGYISSVYLLSRWLRNAEILVPVCDLSAKLADFTRISSDASAQNSIDHDLSVGILVNFCDINGLMAELIFCKEVQENGLIDEEDEDQKRIMNMVIHHLDFGFQCLDQMLNSGTVAQHPMIISALERLEMRLMSIDLVDVSKIKYCEKSLQILESLTCSLNGVPILPRLNLLKLRARLNILLLNSNSLTNLNELTEIIEAYSNHSDLEFKDLELLAHAYFIGSSIYLESNEQKAFEWTDLAKGYLLRAKNSAETSEQRESMNNLLEMMKGFS